MENVPFADPSRRKFLRSALAAGLLMKPASAAAQDPRVVLDAAVLNFLLRVQYVQTELYREGLNDFTTASRLRQFEPYGGQAVFENLRAFMEQEHAHVEAIRSLAQALSTMSATAPPPKPEAPPEWITAQHILIAYKGADKSPRNVTRSKADAKKLADEVRAKADKMEFEDLAQMYSDDPSGKERRGSVGKIKRESVVKEFADAAWALKVDQISPVVETQFGFHIIKRNQ